MWGSGVILPALLLTLDKCSSWRVGRVVPMIRSAVRTTLRSLLRSDLVAELNQLLKCRGLIQWWQRRNVSAAPVAGGSSSAGEGRTASAGPFSPWTQCDCATSGPEKLWCPGIWMTPLQSQCCSWWCGGASPEVHDHLHSFERVKLQVVQTAPDSQLLYWGFNLILCVDLFTHLAYMLYSINVCMNFPHYKLESCGKE